MGLVLLAGFLGLYTLGVVGIMALIRMCIDRYREARKRAKLTEEKMTPSAPVAPSGFSPASGTMPPPGKPSSSSGFYTSSGSGAEGWVRYTPSPKVTAKLAKLRVAEDAGEFRGRRVTMPSWAEREDQKTEEAGYYHGSTDNLLLATTGRGSSTELYRSSRTGGALGGELSSSFLASSRRSSSHSHGDIPSASSTISAVGGSGGYGGRSGRPVNIKLIIDDETVGGANEPQRFTTASGKSPTLSTNSAPSMSTSSSNTRFGRYRALKRGGSGGSNSRFGGGGKGKGKT